MQDQLDQFDAVVVTGKGRAFSAGGDLEFLAERAKDTPSRNAEIMMKFYERMMILRRLPVPTVAAINGPAIGAGLALSLLCDLRVASESANMSFSFTKLGLHPGMGSTFFLPKIVGHQQASNLLLTGDRIDGTEAAKIGLVLKAVPEEKVLEEATVLATKIANNGPVAVRSLIRTLRMHNDIGLEGALRREADSQAASYASKDFVEGLAAFHERREPRFVQSEKYGHGLLFAPSS
jgi:enoyl-CoA hydratase/carnithine racemase